MYIFDGNNWIWRCLRNGCPSAGEGGDVPSARSSHTEEEEVEPESPEVYDVSDTEAVLASPAEA